MPPVTLAAVVDLSKIKMKWKEVYVSEGLNRKVIPSMSKGIYSGLRMVQNISSPRQVEVTSAPDGTHAAVHQSATGFSTTYHDVAGVSTILNLSNASLDNQETVIALSITYIIGADTTANWIAYPIADWNALTDAQRAERIVLGTVNVPAPATNITTSMINQNRRTMAWESVNPEAVPWSAIVKNPSFEHGVTGDTTRFSISDWDKGTVNVNGAFQIGTATVRSGAKSLEYNKTAVGASLNVLAQYQEIPVVPGQRLRITGWIRQLIAPTAGTTDVGVAWGDADSIPTAPTNITISVNAATDASFRKFDHVIEVPAGSFTLKIVAISTQITTGSTGVAFVIDDFQVYLETGSPQAIQGAINSRVKQQLVSSVIFEEGDTYELNQIAALARFIKSTPASEGSLRIERKDQVAGSLPPALSLVGRIVDLGANLIGTEANSLLPRVTAAPSATAGFDFTLMWESKPSGLSAYRKYVSRTGQLVETCNAYWDGTNWNKDTAGVPGIKYSRDRTAFKIYRRQTDAAWSDAAWEEFLLDWDYSSGATITTPAFFVIGDITASTNSNVSVSGTGKYRRGTRVRVYDGLHAELISLYPGVYDRDLIDFFSGTSLLFWQQAGQEFRIPIHLEEGERLTEVRAYTYNGATDTIAFRLWRQTITVGASLAGTSTQVGATQTSTNHTSIIEQLTISGLSEDMTAPGTVKSWAVELEATGFGGGPISAGIAVFTTIP